MKVDTKWHCSKAATEHKLDVGDAPDHSYVIAQGSCEATASDGDLKEKSGAYTLVHEDIGRILHFPRPVQCHHRQWGQGFNYTYEGTAYSDSTKPVANKWKIASGTGKNKGVKGTGSCAGKMNADGSVDWTCTGTISGMSK